MDLPDPILTEEIRKIGWTDVHTHLNFLDVSPAEAIAAAEAVGIQRFITIGTEPEDHQVVLDLAQEFAPKVFCTLGLHPHEGKVWDDALETWIDERLQNPRVVAVGEIGLDYYYNQSPVDQQQEAFRRQMELAAKHDLPVEIHTRDADGDTVEILKEFKGRVKGIIHCFTGGPELANAALDCGFNLSFSGIVTFKNAQDLRDIAMTTPLDRMHVETDAPFLSPMPVRGKKNRPDHMLWTALRVAELKNTEISTFCQQMKNNAEAMFPRLVGS